MKQTVRQCVVVIGVFLMPMMVLGAPGSASTGTGSVQTESPGQIRQQVRNYLESSQFTKAYEAIGRLPETAENAEDANTRRILKLFHEIDRQVQALSLNNVSITPDKLVLRAQRYILRGQFRVAKLLLRQELFLNPENKTALLLLDRALNCQPDEYVVEDLRLRLRIQAAHYFYHRNFADAAEDLQDLGKIEPQNDNIWKSLGTTFYMAGNFSRAQQSWRQAQYLDPDDLAVLKALERIRKLKEGTQPTMTQLPPEFNYGRVFSKNTLFGIFRQKSDADQYAYQLNDRGFGVGVKANSENHTWIVQKVKSD